MTTPLETALSYVRRGWNPVPVGFREKRPTTGEGWPTVRVTAENAAQHFNGAPQNIGVQLGAASNNLRDIDLDCPEAMAAAPYFLPKTGAIFGRPSTRNAHWLYYADDFGERLDTAALQYRDPSKKMLVELRLGEGGKGAQSVFPGSTHESGEEIRWELDGEPAKVDGAELRRRVEIVAAVALLARNWPELGARHEARLAIGGMLARAGWKLQDADLLAQALKAAVGSDSDDFRPAIKSSFAKVTANQPATGFTTVAEIFGKDVGEKVRTWLRLANTDSGFAWSDGDAKEAAAVSERGVRSLWFDGDAPPEPVAAVVERIIPAQGLTFLGGQSGSAKTFLAIDIGVAVASGQPFFDLETERCGAIYAAAEGAATLSSRLAAAKAARGVSEPLPFAVVRYVPDLADRGLRREFLNVLKQAAGIIREKHGVRVGLVILDTLGAAFSMRDENSAAEMNAVCRAAAQLGDSVGAATLVLAHFGKAQETGIRGSSAIRGAGESVLATLGDRDETTGICTNRRWVHVKSRSGEEGEAHAFELQHVFLGVDQNGEEIGAAKIVRTGRPVLKRKPGFQRSSETSQLQIAFSAAYERLAAGVPGHKVSVDALRDELRATGFLDVDENGRLTNKERLRLSRVKRALLNAGSFAELDGLIWSAGE